MPPPEKPHPRRDALLAFGQKESELEQPLWDKYRGTHHDLEPE